MPDAPLNVLVLTLGSHGDVHPFVGLGMQLRDLGHRVTVLTNPHFEALVESHGLAFTPVGTKEDFDRFADDPAVWSRTRGGVAVLKALGQFIRVSYDALASELRDNTVVVSSTLGLSARILQDARGVPVVTCHLAPFVFRSLTSPPVVAGLPPLEWLPRSVQQHLWNGADRFVLDRALGEVNSLRRELDLEPVEGI
ncbi:MAG: glycosyltransferase, partial [Planctomycetota bacterium]